MARQRDKSVDEIRLMLARKGYTFAAIDRAHRLVTTAAKQAAARPHEQGEAAIAATLDMPAWEIWPSRFDVVTHERLKPQPAENYRYRPRFRHRQKRSRA
jgi:lambda repressor-like predicted transcriptional regulator